MTHEASLTIAAVMVCLLVVWAIAARLRKSNNGHDKYVRDMADLDKAWRANVAILQAMKAQRMNDRDSI